VTIPITMEIHFCTNTVAQSSFMGKKIQGSS